MPMNSAGAVSLNGMPVYYLHSVELRNFRKFESLDLSFARRFTLLIGRNGAGKSSVIGALNIALDEMIPFHQGGYTIPFGAADVHERFFESGSQVFVEPLFPASVAANVVLDGTLTQWRRTRRASRTTTTGSSPLEIYNERVDNTIKSGGNYIIPVVASFGIRRLSWETTKKPNFLKAGSRYRAMTNSLDASEDFDMVLSWWKTEEYEALRSHQARAGLQALKRAVAACIEGATDAVYDFKSEQLLVNINGGWTSLSHASSGYKQFIMVVASLAWRAAQLNPHLEPDSILRVPGIVIIDELDAHLHPEWQRRVVYDLLTTFPNMQFVASTHSPFIIQSVPISAETFIFRLDDLQKIAPEALTLEEVAEYIQLVGQVDRSYTTIAQTAKVNEIIEGSKKRPAQSKRRAEELLGSEPLEPAARGLLELHQIATEDSIGS